MRATNRLSAGFIKTAPVGKHCPIGLVINNTFYNTNKILKEHPNRISKDPDGIITYWMPNGVQLIIER